MPEQTEQPGAVSRFASEATSGLNPLNIIKGLVSEATRPITGGDGSMGILSRIPIIGSEAERIGRIWKQDSGSGAADATLRAIQSIPIIGEPMINIGKNVNEGNYAGALGASTNLAGQALMPEATGAALRVGGAAATGVGRLGVRALIKPTESAQAMTGLSGKAASSAIRDTAARERILPGFFDPRKNTGSTAMARSEGRVAEIANGPAGKVTVDPKDIVWSGPVDRMNLANRDLLPGDRALAVSHAQPHLEALATDMPRSAAALTRNTANSRPLNLTTGAAGNAPRAIQQGTREALIAKLKATGTPEALAMAKQLEYQMRVAPVEQSLTAERPPISSEGVPLVARIKVGIVNRALSPTTHSALVTGNALTSTGKALASIPRDALIRMALMQQMHSAGGGRYEQ